MRLEGLWAALGWFTALPAPKHAQPAAIGQAMPWLPAIGLGLGALYAGLAAAFGAHPLVAGWLVALASLLLTGGMHLDGLADLVDALAAAHADARRFHRVRREPTIGSFGAASIAIIVCGKA
ncbi:MAG: adenosylcobinamide-GDP ribazoletransferase, partial [Zetaproteobacteria bacterium]